MTKAELYFQLHSYHSRANVLTRKSLNDQIIIIYDDHRYLLNILFTIFKNRLIDTPNLIFFDAHDDAGVRVRKSEYLRQIGVEGLADATEKQFSAFVDFDCRADDGGWLSTAMELNLINDVTLIGGRNSSNFEEFSGQYQSEDGLIHKLFMLSDNLEFELGDRGKLGDAYKVDEYRELRNFFGIENHFEYSVNIPNPYILDFDLDFFTMSFNNECLHGWTEKVFSQHFPPLSRQNRFIKQLIADAQIITICREPDYCGSIGDSNCILSFLDKYLFGGSIGTDVTL